MAVVTNTITPIPAFGANSHLVTWTPLVNGDSGDPIELPGSVVRSVQFTGTFGTGGTILMEGSNDGVNYATLTDPQGNAISKTAAGIEQIEENTRYVRPRVSAGDGTTSLSVSMYFRRNS